MGEGRLKKVGTGWSGYLDPVGALGTLTKTFSNVVLKHSLSTYKDGQ